MFFCPLNLFYPKRDFFSPSLFLCFYPALFILLLQITTNNWEPVALLKNLKQLIIHSHIIWHCLYKFSQAIKLNFFFIIFPCPVYSKSVSFKHLLPRIERLSRSKASCRLSLPCRQIHSKWPVIFTRWLNNPFENLLRDSDTLFRFFYCSFWTDLFVYPLQLEGDLFKQQKKMEMNAHSQAFQISMVLGSLITQMALCFQKSLFNPRLEHRDGDLSYTWMDLPPTVSPHLILFSGLAFAWIYPD